MTGVCFPGLPISLVLAWGFGALILSSPHLGSGCEDGEAPQLATWPRPWSDDRAGIAAPPAWLFLPMKCDTRCPQAGPRGG